MPAVCLRVVYDRTQIRIGLAVGWSAHAVRVPWIIVRSSLSVHGPNSRLPTQLVSHQRRHSRKQRGHELVD
jgi:hypothetical protein